MRVEGEGASKQKGQKAMAQGGKEEEVKVEGRKPSHKGGGGGVKGGGSEGGRAKAITQGGGGGG